MIITKRINNNAVLCLDSSGHQVVGLGRGLAQAKLGTELDLDIVDRTFYDVDPIYLDLLKDIPVEYLEVSAQIADIARSMLAYELSPNLEVALADHLHFAVERMCQDIYLSAPLSYDLRQNYPVEFKIAQWALALAGKAFDVRLPNNEASGIAMCIINSVYGPAGAAPCDEAEKRDALLEDATNIVEEAMGVTIDRESFSFARFATHIQYLIQRVSSGEAISSENSDLYESISSKNIQASACVNAIAALFKGTYLHDLTDEEKLYLILHINRICSRPSDRASAAGNDSPAT